MNRDPRPANSEAPERGLRAALSKEMEDEVYGLLGALLGMLEVLSIDTVDPLVPRQAKLIADALRYGDMLRTRVEGLITLLSDPHDTRFQPAPYALRRLVDHAVRGATWSASDKGVSIVLPVAGDWEKVAVVIDPARTDRALRAITDTLVAALAAGDQVVVRVELTADAARLELTGVAVEGSKRPALRELSAVLCAAWERLFTQQGGTFAIDADAMTVRIQLRREPH